MRVVEPDDWSWSKTPASEPWLTVIKKGLITMTATVTSREPLDFLATSKPGLLRLGGTLCLKEPVHLHRTS